MRSHVVILAVVACGNTHSGANLDANGDGCPCDAPSSSDTGSAHATTITVTLTDRPNNAAQFSFVVAYQDGAGPWQVASPPAGDVYTFQVTSAAYGVAWTCVSGGAGNVGLSERDVNLYYFAVAERTSLQADVPARCTDRAPQAVGLTGTITSPPSAALAVAFGARSTFATRSTNGNDAFALETPKSTHDLIVAEVFGTGTPGDFVVDSAVVQRDLAVTGPTATIVDWNASQTLATGTVTVLTPFGSARVDVSTSLLSAGKTLGEFVHETSAPFTTAGFDVGQAAPGDVYDQQIAVSEGAGFVVEQSFVDTIADQTFVAATPLGTVMPSVASHAPYAMIAAAWPAYTGAIGYAWQASQIQNGGTCAMPGGCLVAWAIDVSPGYVGGAPQIAMPDLSGLTGWDPRLQMVNATAVNGSVTADTSTAGAADFPEPTFASVGTQRTNVGTVFTITP